MINFISKILHNSGSRIACLALRAEKPWPAVESHITRRGQTTRSDTGKRTPRLVFDPSSPSPECSQQQLPTSTLNVKVAPISSNLSYSDTRHIPKMTPNLALFVAIVPFAYFLSDSTVSAQAHTTCQLYFHDIGPQGVRIGCASQVYAILSEFQATNIRPNTLRSCIMNDAVSIWRLSRSCCTYPAAYPSWTQRKVRDYFAGNSAIAVNYCTVLSCKDPQGLKCHFNETRRV